jgi:enamine deaminase RidA (YjgF/YER057c/UK114 family)
MAVAPALSSAQGARPDYLVEVEAIAFIPEK